MKKPLLNEEINKMRKMMGLNEAEDFDLSSVDNPNAYTDDIINHNAEREYVNFEKDYDFDFEKAAIESASGEEVVQREFDDYDRPLYYSVKDDNVHYFIGDGDNGPMIIKYNAETGERYPIGDLKDYDAPELSEGDDDTEEGPIQIYKMYKKGEVSQKDFNALMGVWDRADKEKLMAYIRSQEDVVSEGGRSDMYDDSHGSPYDRGHSDAYYGREKDPHKYPEGSYNGERVTDLTPEEIEAYNAGYEGCTDFKDWGGLDEIAESEISEGSMESGVYYDTTVAHEIKTKVGNLHKIAPYVLEIGDRVIEDISGKISIYDGENLIEKFPNVDAFLVGIKYGATPV